VIPFVTRGPYLSALEIRSLYIKRYINSPTLVEITLTRVISFTLALVGKCKISLKHIVNLG